MPPSSATAAASPRSLILLLLLIVAAAAAVPSLARSRHTISLPTSALRPNTLAWDPTAQHFLIASSLHPTVSSVSDAGVVSLLLSSPNSSISSLAVDPTRRRLLLALSNPAAVSAYDLRSPRPHRLIFSTPLPDPSAVPGGIAVDAHKGDAFVTGRGKIYKIGTDGIAAVLSQSRIYNDSALDGVAHVRKGFLLAVQRSSGRVFKVDEEDGAARAVLLAPQAAAPPPAAVAVTSDGAAAVAGGDRVRVMRSGDGWSEAAVADEAAVGEGEEAAAVAVREGRRVYVMVISEEGEGKMGTSSSRIEEVEFGREGEGDMVWGMVLVGLGMAYFMYWRFQMGKLVTSINKKRA